MRRYRGPLLAGIALTIAAWAFVSFAHVFQYWLYGDARLLENWGNWIADHQIPYRDFGVEYPPLSLPTFVVPVYLRKLAGHYDTWYFWFRIELLVIALLLIVTMTWALAGLRASKRHAYLALAVAGVAPALLGPNALFHYDYWPALLAAAAVASLVARRGVLACAFAAAGAAAKVFPIVLVPIALIELWRRGRWRAVGEGVGATLAVLLVTIGPFAVVAPHGVWWAIRREATRPLEIESVGATVLTAAHELFGLHLHVVAAAASHGLGGSAPDAVAEVTRVLTVLALAGVYWLYARSERTANDLAVACASAVTAYVVFAKVFSPQYLLWLVPLVPLVGGRRGLRASALLVVILGVTQIFEPYKYADYWQHLTTWVTWTVILRNALVVALLAVLVWPSRARRLDWTSPGRP
ncbi:MAG TPA: hypothetical protein VMJ49_13240 [Gaiellaceae bacterium]|nr:hypothetical protein [Gaiellaceae bacterium]